jgi:hypothetical protein
MALAPRRRRRRRPWGLYFVLVILGVASVLVVSSARSDGPQRRLNDLAYLDQVRPLVNRSTSQGAALSQLRADGVRVGKQAMTRGLERIARESDAVFRELDAAQPPASMSTSHSMLLSTMFLRYRAASGIQRAVNQVYEAAPLPPLVDALVSASQDLSASDRTYQVFVESVPVEARASAMPPSRWVEDPAKWGREEILPFVATLRAGATPAALHDVTLVVLALKPSPVGKEGEAAVLPLLRNLALEVVVANTGNQDERDVAVSAAFVGAAGEGPAARELVNLAPGQRRAVQLRGLQQPGVGPASLRVLVGPVAGETSTDDNQRMLPVVVRG